MLKCQPNLNLSSQNKNVRQRFNCVLKQKGIFIKLHFGLNMETAALYRLQTHLRLMKA